MKRVEAIRQENNRQIANPKAHTFPCVSTQDIKYLLDRLERAEKRMDDLLQLAAWDDFATDDGSEHPIVQRARQFLSEEA